MKMKGIKEEITKTCRCRGIDKSWVNWDDGSGSDHRQAYSDTRASKQETLKAPESVEDEIILSLNISVSSQSQTFLTTLRLWKDRDDVNLESSLSRNPAEYPKSPRSRPKWARAYRRLSYFSRSRPILESDDFILIEILDLLDFRKPYCAWTAAGYRWLPATEGMSSSRPG